MALHEYAAKVMALIKNHSSFHMPHDTILPLQKLRSILCGRPFVPCLRFVDLNKASYSQPDPTVPLGTNHKQAANYYHMRDARRLVSPPDVVVDNSSTKLLEEGTKSDVSTKIKLKTPGAAYNFGSGFGFDGTVPKFPSQ